MLRRRLPKQFGRLPIFVTPGCGLRYWGTTAKIDPMLYRMAQQLVKPGAVVWDVGANLGLFTFCAAALSGRSGHTLAIEPDGWLCDLMHRSMEINQDRLGKIAIENVAIGESSGAAFLEVSDRSRAFNRVTNSGNAGVSVRTLTLDSLLATHPPPSILKIDVESFELQVLKGASEVLRKHRPSIWCEVDRPNSQAISDLLHGSGYDLFSPVSGQKIEKANWHTLAIRSA
ncbi:MAG TPA: FkbM family methyltransferase [Terriglobales bacterium]|nr:FkbM family methyltransferase [Terriglobales bacterium]